MVMVNGEPGTEMIGMPFTYGATSLLFRKKISVLSRGDTVLNLKSIGMGFIAHETFVPLGSRTILV